MNPSSIEMLQTAATAADKMGGENLVALDVSEPMPLADIFFIVTGRSERNVVAISDEIERELLETGHKLLRREGKTGGRWVLCDFGDLVVHVFHAEDREYYALERLWKDCPTVPFELPTRPQASSDFAG
ncbi:ribosomal silencing factor RsfS [Microbacterium faecale]|uniref:Ribosomal silencing factor RsfS n=2 Tax=Microbacterium faecale TaxID=1804630 RepID=A0A917DGZ4_9MICO|nr:ribosomal silencing factor RsfS [Microbacterium faecale]